MIDFSARVVVPKQVIVRQLDDEMVILDLESEHYYGLDSVGTAIWNELAAAETIEAAYESLLDQYDVEPNQLRSDLDELLTELIKGKLVQLSLA